MEVDSGRGGRVGGVLSREGPASFSICISVGIYVFISSARHLPVLCNSKRSKVGVKRKKVDDESLKYIDGRIDATVFRVGYVTFSLPYATSTPESQLAERTDIPPQLIPVACRMLQSRSEIYVGRAYNDTVKEDEHKGCMVYVMSCSKVVEATINTNHSDHRDVDP